jgi:hypothetical protein
LGPGDWRFPPPRSAPAPSHAPLKPRSETSRRDLFPGGHVVDGARSRGGRLGLYVLGDACADSDDEFHQILMERVFPTQAEVIMTDDLDSLV